MAHKVRRTFLVLQARQSFLAGKWTVEGIPWAPNRSLSDVIRRSLMETWPQRPL